MKKVFIVDLLRSQANLENIKLYGWLTGRKHRGGIIFFNVTDSTGTIQVVVEKEEVTDDDFRSALHAKIESSIEIDGHLVVSQPKCNEVRAKKFSVIGKVLVRLAPSPRSDFDIFDERYTKKLLDYRHIYLRNPKIMGILKFRSELMSIVREWFANNRFIEFDAPILTPAPLYAGTTAIPVEIHGERVYLTQCAGFYLEAAVLAFEKVYNMGPSFRGEESRSKRHLMEYWHIKAEIAHGNREDIIKLVEEIISHVTRECQSRCQETLKTIGKELCLDGLRTPYPQIPYEKAVGYLQSKGFSCQFGEGISTAEEEELSKLYNSPFWIVGVPRSVEPFPYVIDQNDTRLTMVADLIASRGCGELLGVAEKICSQEVLEERLCEKGKDKESCYQFVRDVHQYGCVPHIAFGMGLERLIRWLLGLPHVRDAIGFPRVVRRRIRP